MFNLLFDVIFDKKNLHSLKGIYLIYFTYDQCW